MKTLILYKTLHGSTKQYAEWIHEELTDSTIANIDEFDTKSLANYDTVIIGSYVQGGQMPAVEFLQNSWDSLKSKRVLFFAVGMIPATSFMSRKSYEMIPLDIRKNITYMKLPGQVTYKKMGFFEKLLFKLLFGANPESRIDRCSISPIVEFAIL